MKTSAKIKGLLLFALTGFFGLNAQAQALNKSEESTKNYDQGWRLGFGLNAGMMTDNAYDFALGGDVRLQYDFNRRISVTLTSGFTNLFVGDEGKDLGFVPVKGGFKVFWWEDQFYILAEAGAAIPVTNDYSDTVDTGLLLSPGIGWANKYVDLSLRYEHYSEFPTGDGDKGVGQIALRAAYGFRL